MRLAQLAAATLLALVTASGSSAGVDSGKIRAITKAADTFAALGKDAHVTGSPPRQSDPVVKPLLDLVLDTSEIEGGPTLTMSALDQINPWISAVTKIGLIYTLAGTGAPDLQTLMRDPKAIAKSMTNAATFAPEMGRYFDAQLRLQGAVVDTVLSFIATSSRTELGKPNVKSGLSRIRSGAKQSVLGVVTTLPVEPLSNAWRQDRIKVLLAIAPKLVQFLGPEDLSSIRDAVDETSRQLADPTVSPSLAAFGAAMTVR